MTPESESSLDPAGPTTSPSPARRRALCGAAGLASLALTGHSRPALALRPPKADAQATLNALQATLNEPGHPLASLVALAVRDDAVVFEAALGLRDIEHRLPATTDTLYRIASISKFVTALGFMQWVEKGQIDLDADIGRYLGALWRNPNFPDQPINSRMLLSHTSSLRDESDFFGARVGQRLESALGLDAPASKPGGYWAAAADQAPARGYFTYANVNFVVLGTLIERVAQQRFDRYMRERIFSPLGLRASFNPAQDFDAAAHADLATLYRKSPDRGTTWAPRGPWVAQGPDRTGTGSPAVDQLERYEVGSNAGVFGPQGGLRISVRGLGTLLRLMLGQGQVDGVQLLQPATVQAMQSRQWTYQGPPAAANGDNYQGLFLAWGLGLQRFTGRGGPAGTGDRIGAAVGGFTGAGHLGDAYGLLSGLMFDPVTRTGMAYAIGGTSADPERYRGRYSAFSRWEESVLAALHRHLRAIATR